MEEVNTTTSATPTIATENVENELQISSDQVYLTQDGDGQIIFVVHPDQQFANTDGNQVVYIETPQGAENADIIHNPSNIQVIQGGDNVPLEMADQDIAPKPIHATELVPEIPVKNQVEIGVGQMAVETIEQEVKNVSDAQEAESVEAIAQQEPIKEKVMEVEVVHNDPTIVEKEKIEVAIIDEKKSDNKTAKSNVEIISTVLKASDVSVESNLSDSKAQEVKVLSEEITSLNKSGESQSNVMKTPEKNISSESNFQSPNILRDVSPNKPVNLKPMPESGPFILHKDDFEMDDADDALLASKTAVTTNGKTSGNIFEKIQDKINDISPKSTSILKKTEQLKTPEKNVDTNDNSTKTDNSSCRRSQRSKRPPEKFVDIPDTPSPQKRMKPNSTDHLKFSPLKLTIKETKVVKSPCKMYIRYQQTPSDYPSSMYRCDMCHYTTTRLDNIVTHHKTHLSDDEFSPFKDVSNFTSVKDFSKPSAVKNLSSEMQNDDAPKKEDTTIISSDIDTTKDRADVEERVPSSEMLEVKKVVAEEVLSSDAEIVKNSADVEKSVPSIETSEVAQVTAEESKVDESIGMQESLYSDSDEDLPIGLDYSTLPETYKYDDIVIVNWRKIQWPAWVYKVYPKKKMVDIMVIQSPFKQTWMKLPMKKVKAITEKNNFMTILDGHKYTEQLQKAIRDAQGYQDHKIAKTGVSASEYFRFKPDSKTYEPISSQPSVANENIDDNTSSPDESPASSPLHPVSPAESPPHFSESTLKQQKYRIEKGSQLVDYIVQGGTDSYLFDIYHKNVSTKRSDLFFSYSSLKRRELKFMCSFGPIELESQQTQLVDYLMNLIKERCDEFFDVSSFVFEVWVPHAIMKAIQSQENTSESEAEKIFEEGVKKTDEELKIASKKLHNVPLTAEQKAAQEERLRYLMYKYNMY